MRRAGWICGLLLLLLLASCAEETPTPTTTVAPTTTETTTIDGVRPPAPTQPTGEGGNDSDAPGYGGDGTALPASEDEPETIRRDFLEGTDTLVTLYATIPPTLSHLSQTLERSLTQEIEETIMPMVRDEYDFAGPIPFATTTVLVTYETPYISGDAVSVVRTMSTSSRGDMSVARVTAWYGNRETGAEIPLFWTTQATVERRLSEEVVAQLRQNPDSYLDGYQRLAEEHIADAAVYPTLRGICVTYQPYVLTRDGEPASIVIPRENLADILQE